MFNLFRIFIISTQKFPSLAEQHTFLGDKILMTFETSFITLYSDVAVFCFVTKCLPHELDLTNRRF